MYVVIFGSALVFHLAICKIRLKSFTSPFALYGLIWFGLLFSMQLPIIEFNPLPPLAVFIYLLAYVAFLIPNLMYTHKDTVRYITKISNANKSIVDILALATTLVFIIFTLIYCGYVIKYFGGLRYIFTHAYAVRAASIGQQIAPLAVTYGLSIGYAAAGFCAYLLFFKKTKLKNKMFYVIPFIMAFAIDLLTFGRMGTVFYSIIYLGTYLLKFNIYNKKQKRLHIKFLVLICIVLIIILLIPKLIRSDGNISGYTAYAYYKGTSALWGSFLHFYTYATGPLAAFGNYINNFTGPHLYGQAQLLPIFNMLYRLTGGALPKYSILYEFTSVPFETNIYTYLREAFDDFGYFGVALTPFILGLLIYLCNRCRMRNQLIKVMLMQYVYLYALFSVFYTPYSQGGPALGMMMYFVIVLFSGVRVRYMSHTKVKVAARRGRI